MLHLSIYWKINTQIQKASLTNLLFKRTDVPPVQSENIQEASGIQDIFLSRLITGQSCQRGNTDVIHVRKYEAWKKPACLLHSNITAWCYIPLRSWSSVVDSWLSLHDWTAGEPANFSSHLMKDGHDANPWSNEFRKQVLPKFNKPGTIPERKHKSF